MSHEHQYAAIKNDGLGFRCACGHLRETMPPSNLWDAVLPSEADHEHEFAFIDQNGWHCVVPGCDAIRKVG